MTRILLLDDSLTIHKVVRLTFASSPEMELKVGKTPAETQELLRSFRPDVVIAYIRFTGEANPEYFKTIREHCAALLLLTESSENLEPFRSAGFANFLKKPFHSEELRQTVKGLSPAAQNFAGSKENSEFNNTQEDEATLAMRAPQALSPRPAAAPPPPPPPSQQAFRSTVKAKNATEKQADRALEKASEEKTVSQEIPQMTMDIEALEKSYRATLSQRDKPSAQPVAETLAKPYEPPSDFTPPPPPPRMPVPPSRSSAAQKLESAPHIAAPTSNAPAREFHFSSEETIESSLKFDEPFVFEKTSMVPEIEIDSSISDEPLVLENVVMHNSAKKVQAEPSSFQENHAPSSRMSVEAMRHEIEVAIDDALLRALERSVPAKIEQKLQAEWSRFVNDVGNKVRSELQLTVKDLFQREMTSVRNGAVEQIRDSIRPEFKNQVQSWISRESVHLAKEVVREEIRKLLEE